MPLQKLQFRPGINRENTTYASEGGYFASNKIRFRSGQPEKIGGWEADTGTTASTLVPPTGKLWGVARNMINWLNLAGYNLLGIGTNLKYYIQNGVGGFSYDVTALRTTTAAGEVTFSATNGSPTLTVTDIAHGAQAGDFVTYSGAVTLGGNITATILNAEFQIASYVSSNQYTITASVNADASDSGNGGGAVVGAYQITTGSDIYTQNIGWGAGAWGGAIVGTVTNQLDGSINNSVTTITVDDATAFSTPTGTLLIDSETITYTGTTGTTFTGCTRGVNGVGSGAAVSHADNAAVVQSTSFIGWGQPATVGIGVQLRLWSHSPFGEDLIFNPRGTSLFYWANAASASTFNRAQLLGPSATIVTKSGSVTTDSNCPTVANFVMVSDASRFVIAYGCNDYGSVIQDPLLVRWSDQESFATWTPAIVTAMQTRQEILVLTDTTIYSMQYLGPPFVWGFQIMGDNISIAGPNAVATANNITYWMGTDKFYMYAGRVQTLPCTLREYVYNDINLEQSYQFCSGTNEGYSEIWWHYCSSNSTVINRYIIYNYLENSWYYGDWNNYQGVSQGRTAWLDSSLRAFPMAITYGVTGGSTNAQLLYHEDGADDGTENPSVPIAAEVTSSDFDIGDGHNFGFVWRLIPDLTFDGSFVNNPTAMFTVLPRANSGSAYGSSNNPNVISTQNYQNTRSYAIQQFTQQVYVRIRGRQMAFKISSNTLGVQWQLGVPRIDIRPDGRR
jgi:hypothetical protein